MISAYIYPILDLRVCGSQIKAEIRHIKRDANLINLYIDTVCEYFKISFDKVKSNSRKKNIVRCRNILCYLIYQNSLSTLEEICQIINKSRPSISYSKNQISIYINIEEKTGKLDYTKDIEAIKRLINERTNI